MKETLFSENSFKVYLLMCLLAIEFLATTTTVHIELVESVWDKANHFFAFFVLYFLLSFAYGKFSLLVKISFLLAFGLQIEIVQDFTGRSDFSMLDIFADGVGVAIGVASVWIFRGKNLPF